MATVPRAAPVSEDPPAKTAVEAPAGDKPAETVPVPTPPRPAVAPAPAPQPVAASPTEPLPAPARIGRDEILEAEQLLASLGYWAGMADGKLDAVTRSALVAFQKVEGRRRTGRLTPAELVALRAAVRPAPLEAGPAHVEVDIKRQVLFVVNDDGVVDKILPVSTGNGKRFTVQGVKDRAYTPRGRCTVYRKIRGTRVAPLGEIFFPNYLVGGIAIHGSPSIPAQPASHGCIRIPMFAAKGISDLTPVGTVVLVHDGGSFENDAEWQRTARRNPPANSDGLIAAR
jgi:peptidoglycan hydrolase-like protein with peptidoglycan-binding domain